MTILPAIQHPGGKQRTAFSVRYKIDFGAQRQHSAVQFFMTYGRSYLFSVALSDLFEHCSRENTSYPMFANKVNSWKRLNLLLEFCHFVFHLPHSIIKTYFLSRGTCSFQSKKIIVENVKWINGWRETHTTNVYIRFEKTCLL